MCHFSLANCLKTDTSLSFKIQVTELGLFLREPSNLNEEVKLKNLHLKKTVIEEIKNIEADRCNHYHKVKVNA